MAKLWRHQGQRHSGRSRLLSGDTVPGSVDIFSYSCTYAPRHVVHGADSPIVHRSTTAHRFQEDKESLSLRGDVNLDLLNVTVPVELRI